MTQEIALWLCVIVLLMAVVVSCALIREIVISATWPEHVFNKDSVPTFTPLYHKPQVEARNG